MRLVLQKNGVDIAENIELRGKSNPFGWSCYEVFHTYDVETDAGLVPNEEHVCQLYCGEVRNLAAGWTYRMETDELTEASSGNHQQ